MKTTQIHPVLSYTYDSEEKKQDHLSVKVSQIQSSVLSA